MKKIIFIAICSLSGFTYAADEKIELTKSDTDYINSYLTSYGISNPKLLNSKVTDHKGFKNFEVTFEGLTQKKFATTGELSSHKTCGLFKFADFDGKMTPVFFATSPCDVPVKE